MQLRLSPNVSKASEVAGITRQMAYWLRDNDPDFRQTWDYAIEDAVDSLEQAAWDRATKGVVRVRFAPDGAAFEERHHSDALAKMLLEAHRPEKYRQNPKVTVNVFQQSMEQAAEQLGLSPAAFIEEAHRALAGVAIAAPHASDIIGDYDTLDVGDSSSSANE